MNHFVGKIKGGELAPLSSHQKGLLKKLLSTYENNNTLVKVTYEIVAKNINQQQKSLYRAFIVKAADYFGDDYKSMEDKIERFKPKGIHIDKWSSKDLDDFINKSSSFLGQFGFHF